jgi:hypothetical protein
MITSIGDLLNAILCDPLNEMKHNEDQMYCSLSLCPRTDSLFAWPVDRLPLSSHTETCPRWLDVFVAVSGYRIPYTGSRNLNLR